MSNYLEQRRQQKTNGKLLVEKKRYSIPKKSQKKIAEEKIEKEARSGDTELQKFYKGCQKLLTGACARCGTPYNMSILHYAICATAHILPKEKNKFPSVALHPANFIELGSYCGCHHWYDNQASWEEIKASPIWPIILERFKKFEPFIKERKKIPNIFIDETTSIGPEP